MFSVMLKDIIFLMLKGGCLCEDALEEMEKCINGRSVGKSMSLGLLITLGNDALCFGQKHSNQFSMAKVY